MILKREIDNKKNNVTNYQNFEEFTKNNTLDDRRIKHIQKNVKLKAIDRYLNHFRELNLSKTPDDKKNEKIDRIKKIIFQSFQVNPGNESEKIKLNKFLQKFSNSPLLGRFLFGSEFEVIENPGENALLDFFYKYVSHYGYCNNNDFERFKEIYKVLRYVAMFIEGNDNESEVKFRAYKLMVLFGSDDKVLGAFDSFINRFASHYQNPVHDILYINIPKNTECNMDFWKKHLYKKGCQVLKLLNHAKEIERKLNGEFPEDFKILKERTLKLGYVNSDEMPELAELYSRYNVSEKIFERTRLLMKEELSKIKSSDDLPNISIDIGKEVNPAFEGYYLVRLPAGDLRGLFLGEITNCCQSIGGNSESCVIDGMTLPNNGFYVLVCAKKLKGFNVDNIDWKNFEDNGHQIIGQGYFWRSETSKSIVIDSWENLRAANDQMLAFALLALGRKMVELGYCDRVAIGMGGKTPEIFKQISISDAIAERPLEGMHYSDSKSQKEIIASEKLQELRKRIKAKNGPDGKFFRNVSQAAAYLEMLDSSVSALCQKFLESFLEKGYTEETVIFCQELCGVLHEGSSETEALLKLFDSKKFFSAQDLLSFKIEDFLNLTKEECDALYYGCRDLYQKKTCSFVQLRNFIGKLKERGILSEDMLIDFSGIGRIIEGSKLPLEVLQASLEDLSNEQILILMNPHAAILFTADFFVIKDFLCRIDVRSVDVILLLENLIWSLLYYDKLDNPFSFLGKEPGYHDELSRELDTALSNIAHYLAGSSKLGKDTSMDEKLNALDGFLDIIYQPLPAAGARFKRKLLMDIASSFESSFLGSIFSDKRHSEGLRKIIMLAYEGHCQLLCEKSPIIMMSFKLLLTSLKTLSLLTREQKNFFEVREILSKLEKDISKLSKKEISQIMAQMVDIGSFKTQASSDVIEFLVSISKSSVRSAWRGFLYTTLGQLFNLVDRELDEDKEVEAVLEKIMSIVKHPDICRFIEKATLKLVSAQLVSAQDDEEQEKDSNPKFSR